MKADIAELIKNNNKPTRTESSTQNPTIYSYVYLRIQPYITTFEVPSSSSSEATSSQQAGASDSHPFLQFVLYLSDPAHELTHTTVTQAIPGRWLELWDKYDWVEDSVVEVLRVGVEVIGQEYIASRMSWDNKPVQEPVEVVVDQPAA